MKSLKSAAAAATLIALTVPLIAAGKPTSLGTPERAVVATAAPTALAPPNVVLQEAVFHAIERGIRTLPTHAERWRVAYFIKYNEMPRGEMPTVNEAYVYHSARYLLAEQGLTDLQRLQIVNAIYPG